MERFGKTRLRRGFTIAEVLVVVAILAVLLGFAAPAVIGAFVRMHLSSLDNSAATIFAAAQNSMTAMVGNGELESFAPSAPGVVSELGSAANIKDFPTDELGSAYADNLRYLDSAGGTDHETALKQLLPGGSIESKLAEHRYIIEYNCETGAVYAVWYSDEEDFQTASGTSAYNAFASQDRGFDDRLGRRPLVGYYGGSGVEYGKVNQMPLPKLTLTNAEELRLKIDMPEDSTFTTGDIGLEITAKDASGTEIHLYDRNSIKLDAGQTFDLLLDTLKSYTEPTSTLVNGQKYGKQFKDWADTTGAKLHPGEDITVTVTTCYAGSTGKGPFLSQSATVTGNSLFAAVKEMVGTGNYAAQIAYGRHLQNLDTDTSGVNASGAAVTVTAAEQMREIDFNAVNGTGTPGSGSFARGAVDDDIYYWANTYANAVTDGVISDNKTFNAIYNTTLKSYDGHGLPIRALNAVHKDKGAGSFDQAQTSVGLFAAFEQGDLKNITLIDAKTDTAAVCAGALAGQVGAVTISNCQVYLDKEKPTAPVTAGAPTPMVYGSTEVGGLVGRIRSYTSAVIENSFASTIVQSNSSTGCVGGLVGTVRAYGGTLTIKNSYAACYLYNGHHAGGLLGYFFDPTTPPETSITNSYAAGIIGKTTGTDPMVGGLVGGTPGVLTVSNSYAAVRYDDSEWTPTAPAVYGVAPGAATGSVSLTNAYYIAQPGIDYAEDLSNPDAYGKAVNSKQLSEMESSELSGTWYGNLPAEDAATGKQNPNYAVIPYRHIDDTAELSASYPYPQLIACTADGTVTGGSSGFDEQPMIHYGDWLEVPDGYLGYCEQYTSAPASSSNCGFYAYLPNADGTPVLVNNLRPGDTTTHTVYAIGDTYGFFVKQGDLCPGDKTFAGGTMKPIPDSADPTGFKVIRGAYIDPATSVQYDFYPYIFTDTVSDDTDYYYSLTLYGQEYWFNPRYACEIVKDQTVPGSPPNKSAPVAKEDTGGLLPGGPSGGYESVIIRTARQLANLAGQTGSTYDGTPTPAQTAAQNRNYVQLLDIDYDKYTGMDGIPFVIGRTNAVRQTPAALNDGSYDGGKFLIRNLYIEPATEGSGLFGHTKGTLRNIRLVNVQVSSHNHYVGALAGYYYGQNRTSVTDCGVYVDLDNAPATFHGNIDDAYTEFRIECTNFSDCSGTGGLIGNVSVFGTASLTNCFAAVKVCGGEKMTGGLIGQVNVAANNSHLTLRDCYSGGHTQDGVYVCTGNTPETDANVSGGNFVGGLIGYVDGSTTAILELSGTVYSTCSVHVKWAPYAEHCGLLIGGGSHDLTLSSATLYATGKAFIGYDSAATPGTPRAEDYLQDPVSLTGSKLPNDDVTFNYDSHWNGQMYPYVTNLDAHHGDWVNTAPSLCYYEEYDSGSDWGVWGYLNSTAGLTQQLTGGDPGSSPIVRQDGYGVLVAEHEVAPAFVTVGTNKYTVSAAALATVEIGGNNYALHAIEGLCSGTNAVSRDSYYNQVTVSGKNYWFNPYYACEISTDARTPGNNLIAKEGAAGDGSSLSGNFSGQVVIRTARQLANLVAETGSATGNSSTLPQAQLAAQGRSYVQLLDIDYARYNLAGFTTGKSAELDARQTPAALTGSYTGNRFLIRNLYIGDGEGTITGGTGLFGSTRGAMTGIRLVNVDVESSHEYVGALAGQYYGTNPIKDCGVYVDGGSAPAPGMTDDDAYDTFTVTGTSNEVGGLIGWAHNNSTGSSSGGAISGCFAAVKVKGANCVGGLIGSLDYSTAYNGVTLENCYSGGHTESGVYDGSGDANVTGTYTGNPPQVGGLIGHYSGSLTFSGVNYSTCSVKADSTRGPNWLGRLIGYQDSGATVPVTNDNIVYAFGSVFDDKGTALSDTAFHNESTYLITNMQDSSVDPGTSPANAHPYEADLPDKYPYLSRLDDHYGDWPAKEQVEATSLCYYEQYVNGDWGVWGYMSPSGNLTHTLQGGTPGNAANPIVQRDGYGVLMETTTAPKTMSVSVDGATYPLTLLGPVKDGLGKQYSLYAINGLCDGTAPDVSLDSNYYH